MQDNKVTGKKFRILVDAVNDVWDCISFWKKASDIEFDDGTTLADKPLGHSAMQRSKAYVVGDVVYNESAPSWVMFVCSRAGTTAATEPTFYGTINQYGREYTDGTARFKTYDVKPSSTLSTSAYQIPAMSLVNNVSKKLTASNDAKFYWGYKDGKYGFYTSSDKRDDDFHPF